MTTVSSEKLIQLRMWALEAVMGLYAANKEIISMYAAAAEAQEIVKYVLSKSDE